MKGKQVCWRENSVGWSAVGADGYINRCSDAGIGRCCGTLHADAGRNGK